MQRLDVAPRVNTQNPENIETRIVAVAEVPVFDVVRESSQKRKGTRPGKTGMNEQFAGLDFREFMEGGFIFNG